MWIACSHDGASAIAVIRDLPAHSASWMQESMSKFMSGTFVRPSIKLGLRVPIEGDPRSGIDMSHNGILIFFLNKVTRRRKTNGIKQSILRCRVRFQSVSEVSQMCKVTNMILVMKCRARTCLQRAVLKRELHCMCGPYPPPSQSTRLEMTPKGGKTKKKQNKQTWVVNLKPHGR